MSRASGRATAADTLSQREREILRRLAAGLSDQQIAAELVLSLNTVKWYNRQIYSKLGVSSRTQAIARAASLPAPASATQDDSAVPPPASHYHLPIQPALFVGRGQEIAEIQRLLAVSRLLTLTGTGGTGKTRLALRAAAEAAARFSDDACFVDLAPLASHTMVPAAIAAALGVVEQSGEQPLRTLERALAGRELLLLLDNFEHVLAAAPVVSALLAAAPRLTVLATSREPLRLADEQEYPVPPLTTPDAEDATAARLLASEAGLLFVRRAQLARPRFAATDASAPVIGRICRRLDGLPLAIELAAARCTLFTPRALLAELEGAGALGESAPLRALTGGARDQPPRLRALRDSIAWSYHLLDADERALFARLAVFRGGRSLEAVEGVCAAGLGGDPLDSLASLVEKNLIQQRETPDGEPRFVMLEMIHEYARERLRASGEEAAMRARHAAYFTAWAERAAPEFRLAGYERWSRLFALNLENLRAALDWSLSADGEVALGVRLAGALCLFWYGNGYHVEGQGWTERLLPRLDEAPLATHPAFLISAGHMAFLRDLDAGKPLFIRARDTARELGDQVQLAWALAFLAYTLLPDPAASRPLVAESIAIFRALDHQPGIAQALNITGEIARYNGEDALARQMYEDCLAVCQRTGERRRTGFILINLAFLALHAGDVARAEALGRQGLALARDMDAGLEMAKMLTIVAGALGVGGHPRQALRLFSASARALERMGAFQQLNDQREIEALLTTARAQLDLPAALSDWDEGQALALEQAVALALGESGEPGARGETDEAELASG